MTDTRLRDWAWRPLPPTPRGFPLTANEARALVDGLPDPMGAVRLLIDYANGVIDSLAFIDRFDRDDFPREAARPAIAVVHGSSHHAGMRLPSRDSVYFYERANGAVDCVAVGSVRYIDGDVNGSRPVTFRLRNGARLTGRFLRVGTRREIDAYRARKAAKSKQDVI